MLTVYNATRPDRDGHRNAADPASGADTASTRLSWSNARPWPNCARCSDPTIVATHVAVVVELLLVLVVVVVVSW